MDNNSVVNPTDYQILYEIYRQRLLEELDRSALLQLQFEKCALKVEELEQEIENLTSDVH